MLYRVCARRPFWRTKTTQWFSFGKYILFFMQTSSIVLVLQHGRRAHTLYVWMQLKVHLNGFNICSTVNGTRCWGCLNRSFNIVENVKTVESVLNRIQIGLNFHSTSIQHFLCCRKCWMVSKPFECSNILPTSVQLLMNECWSTVETIQMSLQVFTMN